MIRSRLLRSVSLVLSVVLLASCAEPAGPGSSSQIDPAARQSDGSGGGSGSSGSLSDATKLQLRAVWWEKDYNDVIKVVKTIGPSGGTISIPETGLTMSFPAGAVSAPITVTVTADRDYVAYKMEPTGTQFAKDVTVTQSLRTTSLYGEPLRTSLYGAYIADDNVSLSGNVPVLELEPSKTIFSPLSALLPEAEVWVIRHFSRYMLASG